MAPQGGRRIFRFFDMKPCNEGAMPGTRRLLEVLRGEDVDSDDWKAKLMPRDERGRCKRRLLEDGSRSTSCRKRTDGRLVESARRKRTASTRNGAPRAVRGRRELMSARVRRRPVGAVAGAVWTRGRARKLTKEVSREVRGHKGSEEVARWQREVGGDRGQSGMFEHQVSGSFRGSSGCVGETGSGQTER